MSMPRRNRQLPTVQLDLFRSSEPQPLDWLGLSAEVREKVTHLFARMLSDQQARQRPDLTDRGQADE
jgi:hypothetical protein